MSFEAWGDDYDHTQQCRHCEEACASANAMEDERDQATIEITVLMEKLHEEKMRNAAVETVMLVVIVLLGLFAVFK